MSKNVNAKVTLVGAGPGDPELISLAGVKALQEANVVLYDALVNKEILKWATQAKKIFVGKRLGYKRFEQSEINHLLLTEAWEHGAVVRLKGGDSFIFGRGGEEIDFLSAFNVETKVIPGISSSTSALTAIGTPLTKRGISEGFWVLTGTKEFEQFSNDIRLASQSNSTVVVLMGMSKLSSIVQLFIENGRTKLPVAIIQSAYCQNQKSVVGTVENIVQKVENQGLKNPAVIVLGEVIKESPSWKEQVLETVKTYNHE